MKNYLLIGSIISFLSCGGSPSVISQNKSGNLETTPVQTANVEINPELLKSYMTFDVLGGVFRKTSSASSSEIIANKGLQSLPSTTEIEEATESGPLKIDFSSQYVGFQRKGRMVISALGSGTESNNNRHFDSLTLRFLFFNYAFNNPCVGNLYLDGEIHCEITGDYQISSKEFSGEAKCINGPKTNPASLFYITPQKNHEINLDADLKINGSIYKYKSYSYTGKIKIDGEELKVEDLIGKGGSCS